MLRSASDLAELASGRRNARFGVSASNALTSTSGFKRHSSAGAGPGEPTAATVRKRAKRATVTRDETVDPRGKKSHSPTRRNDLKTTFTGKRMKGSKTKSKPVT